MSSKVKVWAVTHLCDADLKIRASDYFCKGPKGVLVPQPEGDHANFVMRHPSFTLIDIDRSDAEAYGLAPAPAPSAPKISKTPTPDPEPNNSIPSDSVLDGMTKAELVALASDLGIDTETGGSAQDGSMLKREVKAAIIAKREDS